MQESMSFKEFAVVAGPLAAGVPAGHRNLTLVPLVGMDMGSLDYVLCGQAISQHWLTIKEVSAAGSVNTILAENNSDKYILLLDGEELVGAKQNRILNTTVLIAPKTNLKIPVSCVEQGRWNSVSADFKHGNVAPARLRQRKACAVHRNLKQSGSYDGDQCEVWDGVAEYSAAFCVQSPTQAMSDVVTTHQDSIAGWLDALPYPKNTRGVMAAVNGQFLVMDLFDKASTLEAVWRRLLTGYVVDAMHNKAADGVFMAAQAQGYLKQITACQVSTFTSVGSGHDLRILSEGIAGQALLFENVLVQMSLFSGSAKQEQSNGSPISPPSRRRRRKPGIDDRIID